LKYPPLNGQRSFDRQLADFRDRERMRTLLKGVDVLIHLASAHLSVELKESEYWDVNVHSLPALLEDARSAGVRRLVHVSSVGVYGNLQSWPASEDAPCFPQSIYGITKLAGERAVRNYASKTGLSTIILRPTWVFGPTCPRTRALHRALRKRAFVMIGDGVNMRHPIYIKDMLSALDLAISGADAAEDLFLIGADQVLTSGEVVETMCDVFRLPRPRIRLPLSAGRMIAASLESLCRVIRVKPPVSRRTLEFFHTNNAFDVSRAREQLGFHPRYTFEAGLRDFAGAFDATS
jgi:nucleoside-diphosphate-sugar epimerase